MKAVFTIESITHYPFHVREDLRILFILRGSIIMNHFHGSVELKEGNIEFINMNEPIELIGSEDNLVLILTIKKDYLIQHVNYASSSTYNVNCTLTLPYDKRNLSEDNLENTYTFIQMFFSLYHEYLNTHLILEDNLLNFVLFFSNHLNDTIKHLKCFSNINNEIIHRFLRMEKYIQEHLSEKISLSDLTSIEHLSPQYISNEFKNKYKVNFGKILESYRFQYAIILLLKSDYKISRIAKECGFSDSKYFYRAFKVHLGCTPLEFRRNAQEHTLITKHFDIYSLEIPKGFVKFIQAFDDILKNWDLKFIEKGLYMDDLNNNHKYCLITADLNKLEIKKDEIWCFHKGSSVIVSDQHSHIIFGIHDKNQATIHVKKNTSYNFEFENDDSYCFFTRISLN